MYPRFCKSLTALGLVVCCLLVVSDLVAQDEGRGRRGGGPGRYFRGLNMPGGDAKPNGDKKEEKKEDAEKTDESGDKEKKPEEAKDEGPPPIRRPAQPPRPADPREIRAAQPNDQGKIKFSFKGQPWPTVLEWLADVSDMSLEWEEAPAGYLDFTTRGEYTPEQIRDLLNSVLLNKGFTLLRNGEVLIVANVRRLDPGLVPRLRPDELEERGTFELARVFFDLDWLVAEEAAKEVTPLVNSFGKVTPLKATNRLDVLDTVGNLRRIRDLLQEEQSNSGQQRLVREFKLRYTRAEEVLDTLNTLLGIEPKQQAAANVDPRQMMQAMMMAQQMGGAQGVALTGGKKESSVFLAVNARENSILVNAPPDKMGVIAQAIEAVDVPAARGGGILGNAQRVKVYRLSGLAPETLAKVLKELGSLDPTTKLEVDTKKNALVAYAPLADHVLIGDLVERLDGTSRKFEVVQLRTLSAEYVAGSIMTLMNGPEKKTDNSRNRWFYYDSAPEQTNDTDKFWVEADIERNRLLLRANDVELAEVKALLVKLGELPIDPRGAVTMRVVPFVPDGDTLETIENEVKPTFEANSGHELRMNRNDFKQSTRKTDAVEEAPPRRRAPPSTRTPSASHETRSPKPQSRYRLAQDRRVIGTSDESNKKAQEEPNDTSASSANADSTAPDSEADVADSPEPTAVAADKTDDVGPVADAEADGDDRDSDHNSDNGSEDVDTTYSTDPHGMEAESADDAGAEAPGKEARDADDDADDADEPNDAERRFEESHPDDLNPDDLPRRARAPVKITLGPQGLVISSSDPEALDQLEELLNRMLPRRANFKLFTLKHTYAKDMVSLLKDVFKADMDKESSRTEVFDMFWNGRGSSSSSQSTRTSLGRRRPLNFVADPVTNTVLVQGADTAQLTEVEALIERYDRAEPPNSESVRRTKHVPLKYAKAKEVADVLKDVYRDLLSPNDKALLQNQPQQQQQQRGQNDNFYSAMFSYLTDDPTKSEIVPRFKGMLSVGVDERANGVVVSAPQIILTEVLKMVADLDRSARPSRPVVRIMRVKSPGVANEVRQAVMGKKAEGDIVVKPSADQEIRANTRAGNVQVERSGGGTMVRVSK